MSLTNEVTCKLIGTKSPEWDTAMAGLCRDVCFSSAYHRLCQAVWGGESYLAVVEEGQRRVAWPFVLQPIPQAPGHYDATSVYGFSGPACSRAPGGAEFLSAAWRALNERWREMGVVTVFTRFSPYYRNEEEARVMTRGEVLAEGEIEQVGHCIAIELLSRDEVWYGYHHSVRKEIGKARRAGIRGVEDPNWERFEDFFAVYHSIAERNEFSSRYLLSREAFFSMRDILGTRACMFHAMDGDRAAASALCILSEEVLYGHFGGPHSDYVRSGSYKLLIDYLAEWAAEKGLRYVSLGGGRGSSDCDSLYIFKCAFSKLRLPFHVGRWIVNREIYDRLTADRRKTLEQDGMRIESETYFPLYRAPAIPVGALC